jgi:hypothetical protein
LPPHELGELAADEVQPLLDPDDAVIQLIESLVGPAEQPAYFVETLVDPLEAAVVHF